MNDRDHHTDFEPTADELRALLALVDRRDGDTVSREARLSPDARRALVANRRVAGALSHGAPAVPATVRARTEALVATRGRRRRGVRPRVLAVAGLAVAVVVVAFMAPPLLRDEPTITQVLAIGLEGDEGPAPAAGQPALLDRSFEGVTFPDWGDPLGWHAGGWRDDKVQGRAAETVFYLHEGHRIAYTILAGDPIDPPAQARSVRARGMTLAAFATDDGRDVVVFERGGRTCVLSGHVIDPATLVRLATWKPGERA